jgi:hypothetical protein
VQLRRTLEALPERPRQEDALRKVQVRENAGKRPRHLPEGQFKNKIKLALAGWTSGLGIVSALDRGGSGMSSSPKFGLFTKKPNFFIYVVKPVPKPELCPTYLVIVLSPKNPKPEV